MKTTTFYKAALDARGKLRIYAFQGVEQKGGTVKVMVRHLSLGCRKVVYLSGLSRTAAEAWTAYRLERSREIAQLRHQLDSAEHAFQRMEDYSLALVEEVT